MTYRDALQQVAQGADPADALAEFGLEDTSPDALSSALRHFAETSPIEIADLLSPFLARTSPVPFDVDDLEPLPEADAILADGGDITDLLTDIGLDPTAIDVGATIDAAEEAVAEVTDDAAAAASDADDTFGIGEDLPGDQPPGDDAEAEALDVLEQIGRADDADERPATEDRDEVDDVLDEVDTETFADLIDQIDHIGDAPDIDDLDGSDDPFGFDLS